MKQPVPFRFALALAAAAVAFSQGESPITREGSYWVQTFTGAVDANPTGKLRLITEGNVVIKGGSGSKVSFSVKARVKARNEQQAQALLRSFVVRNNTAGEWLNLTLFPPRGATEGPEVSVVVPRTLRQTWIETHGGSVQSSDLDGELKAESAGGAIDIDRIRSDASARTAGGEIHIGRVGGSLRCYSGAGKISADSVGGESWLDTAGGDITMREARGAVHASTAGGNVRIVRCGGTVFARTAGGLIEVQQSAGSVTAESSGGAIQVNAAQGVRCESVAGAIRLRNVGGSLRANTAAGSILAELLSGNHIEDSTLSTSSGDITVFIASNIPLTVSARNESSGSVGRIISDFPEIRLRPVAGGVAAIAEGALNGGGPILRIHVTGGTIYLRRQK